MAVLLTPPFLQFFDDDGNPLAGGKVYTYAAGTTTPKASYTDASGNTPAANPVVLDAAGRAVIFISGSYKLVVKDANDNTIRTTDNVSSFQTLAASNDAYFESLSGTGSQTAYTLSEEFGTDEKELMVFVDSGLQEHATNGSFASDTGWTKGTGWTIGSGVATATGAISTAIEQDSAVTLVQGQAYAITYTITRSAGGLIPSIGGKAGTERTASGTYSEVIVASSTQKLTFTGNAFTGTLDSVTITPAVKAGFNILSPSAYTISGTALTFATAPATGTNNIYVFAPSRLLGAASAAAESAEGFRDDAEASKTAAAASAAAAAISESEAQAWAEAAGGIAVPDGSITYAKTSAGVKASLDKADGSLQATDYPGALVQSVTTVVSTVQSGTTTMPDDDTVPQNTEGVEFLTVSITPKSATNVLEIEVTAQLAGSGTDKVVQGAIFRDSTAGALAAGQAYQAGAAVWRFPLVHRVTAGSTSATTFKFRAGLSTAGTTYLNANSAGSQKYGGVCSSRITVREYKA